jgi:DoxX-like family
MAVAASLLSIALFLAFASAGIQKLLFNPAMSHVAERLGFSRRTYRQIGLVELLGGVALMAGIVGTGTTFLAILNEAAAGVLSALMVLAVGAHLRKGEKAKYFTPALVLGVAAVAELILRLA